MANQQQIPSRQGWGWDQPQQGWPPAPPAGYQPYQQPPKKRRWLRWTIAGVVGFIVLMIIIVNVANNKAVNSQKVPVPRSKTPAIAPAPSASHGSQSNSLSSQYVATMTAFEASPAWQTIMAQVGPENTAATDIESPPPPVVPDAALANVTAECHNVAGTLNTLADRDGSLANLDAQNAVSFVASDLGMFSNDLSSGFGVPGDINTLHKDDVKARTLLSLPLTGVGAVPAVTDAEP